MPYVTVTGSNSINSKERLLNLIIIWKRNLFCFRIRKRLPGVGLIRLVAVTAIKFCKQYRNAADILTPSAGGNVRKLIPAQCCSFPFTYNSRLYYNECALNATDAVDVGCFLVNKTWVGCLSPTGRFKGVQFRYLFHTIVNEVSLFVLN